MFSTAQNTQRDSQSWVEKRRDGGGDRGDLGEKKESQRERVSWPVISSLCALHSLDPSEMFTELHREEKREEGDRGGQEDKRGNQKERDRSSQ